MKTILPLFLLLVAQQLLGQQTAQLWQEVLSPPQGSVGAPVQDNIEWRTDFYAALDEAKAAGAPMLVTWRCLPCKQCAAFDKNVLEGSPALTPLLKQFVTVRMTDAGQLDDRYFPYRGFQDTDLSWWGYFLSPEGRLYGVFGGKDHVSDATRISEAAFVNSLERILAHHRDPRRETWNIDGEAPDSGAKKTGPRDIASVAKLIETRPHMANQECTHCHQVGDILNFDAMENGTFTLKKFTQPWPLPENVGIVVDRDEGLLVTDVEAGSPAAAAGIQNGDRLAMASGRRLFGQADFRGALHRASYEDANVLVGWTRDEEPMFAQLSLKDGWKEGKNLWRKTIYEGPYGPHLGFFPLKGPNNGKGSMSFKPFMGSGNKQQQSAWWPSGLRPGMEIIEVNGRNDDWDSREFIAWFRMNHKEGDNVSIKVRGGKKFTHRIKAK
ncbi:MAG: serine protease Do [Verrucomicrobiales bacterium]|jgi:serine protease Do